MHCFSFKGCRNNDQFKEYNFQAELNYWSVLRGASYANFYKMLTIHKWVRESYTFHRLTFIVRNLTLMTSYRSFSLELNVCSFIYDMSNVNEWMRHRTIEYLLPHSLNILGISGNNYWTLRRCWQNIHNYIDIRTPIMK